MFRSLHLLLAGLLLARSSLLIGLLRFLLDLVWDFSLGDELLFLIRGLLWHLGPRGISHAVCVLIAGCASLGQSLLLSQNQPLWRSNSLM